MLIPFTQVVFEGLSRDYDARKKELASARFSGCFRLAFADFEGVVFYEDGNPVIGLEESGDWMALGEDLVVSAGFSGCFRLAFADFEGVVFYEGGKPIIGLEESGDWMALGEELVAPLENKASVADGSMAIYRLSPDLVAFFSGRKIGGTVETETGPLLGPRALVDNLLRDRSACILRIRGPAWISYAFIAGGRVIDAAFAAEREALDGERAASALREAAGRATAVIYFLEGGAPFVEVTPAPEPPVAVASPPSPVQAPPEHGAGHAAEAGPALGAGAVRHRAPQAPPPPRDRAGGHRDAEAGQRAGAGALTAAGAGGQAKGKCYKRILVLIIPRTRHGPDDRAPAVPAVLSVARAPVAGGHS